MYRDDMVISYGTLGDYVTTHIQPADVRYSDVGGPGWSFRLQPKFWADRPSDNKWTNHFVVLAAPGVGGSTDTEYVPIMFFEYIMAPYVWPAEKDEGTINFES